MAKKKQFERGLSDYTPEELIQQRRSHEAGALRSLALSGIEVYANYIKRDANTLKQHAQQLASLPPFDTQAESALADAKEAIDAAAIEVGRVLNTLLQMRNAHDGKPSPSGS